MLVLTEAFISTLTGDHHDEYLALVLILASVLDEDVSELEAFTSIEKSTVAFLTDRLGTFTIDSNGTERLSSLSSVLPLPSVTGDLNPKSTVAFFTERFGTLRIDNNGTDNSAKYNVHVEARDDGPPEGLMKVLDILNAAIIPNGASTPAAAGGGSGGSGSGGGGGGNN